MNPSPEFSQRMANVLAFVITFCMCFVVLGASVAAVVWLWSLAW